MVRRFMIEDWQQKLNKTNQPLIIIGKHKTNRKEIFTLQCFKCGGVFDVNRNAMSTAVLYREKGKKDSNWCPICHGRNCAEGINDIATVRKELVIFFANQAEAKENGIGSNKQITMKCPECGQTKKMRVADLCQKGFHCDYCSDNISLGNKIIRNLMLQLPIETFEFEYMDSWSKNKRYDCYFEFQGGKYLVEIDGEQHTKNTSWSTKEWQKQNDALKDSLAKQNGFKLIRIKAYKTDFDFIKQNILNSELAVLFDLGNIDWKTILDKTVTSLNIEIARYYMEHKEMMFRDIAKHFHISCPTLTKTLVKLTKLGLCDYSKKEAFTNGRKQSWQERIEKNDPFTVYSPQGKTIGTFKTSKECYIFLSKNYKELNLSHDSLRHILFIGRSFKGYRFVYKHGLYEFHKKNNPIVFDVYNLYKEGMSVKDISEKKDLSCGTIYKYIETVKNMKAG